MPVYTHKYQIVVLTIACYCVLLVIARERRHFELQTEIGWAKTIMWNGINGSTFELGVQNTEAHVLSVNYTGRGQTIGIVDFGLDLDSPLLSSTRAFLKKTQWSRAGPPETCPRSSDKIVQFVSEPAEPSVSSSGGAVQLDLDPGTRFDQAHGTSMASIAAGRPRGISSNGVADNLALEHCWNYAGVAPSSKIAFFDLKSVTAVNGSRPRQLPFDIDLHRDVLAWPYACGARIILNAWTATTSPSSSTFNDAPSLSVDKFMYEEGDVLVISAAGRNKALASPGLSKNGVTVGMSFNDGSRMEQLRQTSVRVDRQSVFPELWTTKSCQMTAEDISQAQARGPTRSGRIKPDVMAQGYLVTSANPVDTTNPFTDGCQNDGKIGVVGGTSVAAAIVSGEVSILRQYLRERVYIVRPSGAMLKASLIASAKPMSGSILDTDACATKPLSKMIPNGEQGWGRPQLSSLHDPSFRMIAPGQRKARDKAFGDPLLAQGEKDEYEICALEDGLVSIVLTWTDPPQSVDLVNDLDLYVEWGKIVLEEKDHVNPVEKISTVAPAGTTISIRVSAKTVSSSKPQSYALLISGYVRERSCSDTPFDDLLGSLNNGNPKPVSSSLWAKMFTYVVLYGSMAACLLVVACCGRCVYRSTCKKCVVRIQKCPRRRSPSDATAADKSHGRLETPDISGTFA